ncbi:MAG TPA: HD domain-containing phosphohydrolase [Candidatus Eisenbacteria bacterium]|nr:HD domain-containing phosphohydrolase [Candidatus Eisenbacteria bacterium]
MSPRRPPINRVLLVLLGVVAVTGAINVAVVSQRAFLNFYYIPVLLGAWLLGRRGGVSAAALAALIVFALAVMNDRQFSPIESSPWQLWLDLGAWAAMLLVTSVLIGTLHEQRERQVRELEDAYRGILEILPRLIDAVDQQTENHSRRVSGYAVEMARALDLDARTIEDIRVGALLHDIGKVDVSADLLRKAAALTPQEFADMQRHVDSGERMVRSMGGILKHVIPMVAFHHERWDGLGYKGLRGEEIPIGARVIAVADTYDAIVNDRPYRRGRTMDEALQILREGSGRQFDPRVVQVFFDLYATPGADFGREAQAA